MKFIEHASQQQQNTHDFQVSMEYSPRYTISWVIEQTLTNF